MMILLLFVILRSIVIQGPAHHGYAKPPRQAKLEEQLNQAQRLAALGNMIAGVAHEIRNPLGIVRSTAELLGSQAAPSEHRPLAGVIVEESSRLEQHSHRVSGFRPAPKARTLRPVKLEEVLERNLHVPGARVLHRSRAWRWSAASAAEFI